MQIYTHMHIHTDIHNTCISQLLTTLWRVFLSLENKSNFPRETAVGTYAHLPWESDTVNCWELVSCTKPESYKLSQGHPWWPSGWAFTFQSSECGLVPWSESSGAHKPLSQRTKVQNRSNIITNSIKVLEKPNYPIHFYYARTKNIIGS